MAADREFEISHQESAAGNHFKIVFTEPLENRTSWYVFADHVEFEDVQAAIANVNSDLGQPKENPSSSQKSSEQKPVDVRGAIGCSTILALIGLILLAVPVVQLATPNDNNERSINVLGWAGVATGLPIIAFGVWYGIDSVYRSQKQREQKIEDAFYTLLDENDGELTLLQFARAADLSGDEAKDYLSDKVREFNATFDVDSDGGIFYHFR